jgi:hypothetical protein
MTPEQCRARARAYEEGADHLELKWTDDKLEAAEGGRLAALWRRYAGQLRELAGDIERSTGR